MLDGLNDCKKCLIRIDSLEIPGSMEWMREAVYSGRVISPSYYRKSCSCESNIEDVVIMRNKILIDLSHTWISKSETGIQNYALNFAKAMKALNTNVVFITNHQGVIRIIEDEIFTQKVNTKQKISLALQKVWRTYLVHFQIIRTLLSPLAAKIYHYLNQENFSKLSIVPLNCIYIAPESVLDRQKVQSLTDIQNCTQNVFYLCVHDAFPVTHPEFTSEYTRNNIANFLDLVFATKNFVCQTETVKKSLELLLSARKIISVPNLFSDAKIEVVRRPVLSSFQKHLEPIVQSNYFVSIGTIEPRKNLLQLLEVFEEIWVSGQLVELKLFGSYGWNCGREKEKISELISKGYPLLVKANSTSDEIYESLKSSRGLILTSIAEGVGLTPGEAISLGVPAIVNSIPSVLESYPRNLLNVYDGTNTGLRRVILENLNARSLQNDMLSYPCITWEDSAKEFLRMLGEHCD
jgi:glycosyltransferase involved in cell wall biosynthesis